MKNATQPTVITIKWGTEFIADDVNILKRAAVANTTNDLRFICLTDDDAGLESDILALPIPISGLETFPRSSCGWGKICLFHPSLNSLFEHALFLDIDTVIVGSLDAFYTFEGPVMNMLGAGQYWRKLDDSLPPVPATGAFTYSPTFHNNIFETFKENPEAAYENFELEQDFVGFHVKEKDFLPVNWIESFKYHLRQNPVADLMFQPRRPKPATKLVAFHGFPRPRDVAEPGRHWAHFPRSGINRPRWLTDYWSKYGYTDSRPKV